MIPWGGWSGVPRGDAFDGLCADAVKRVCGDRRPVPRDAPYIRAAIVDVAQERGWVIRRVGEVTFDSFGEIDFPYWWVFEGDGR